MIPELKDKFPDLEATMEDLIHTYEGTIRTLQDKVAALQLSLEGLKLGPKGQLELPLDITLMLPKKPPKKLTVTRIQPVKPKGWAAKLKTKKGFYSHWASPRGTLETLFPQVMDLNQDYHIRLLTKEMKAAGWKTHSPKPQGAVRAAIDRLIRNGSTQYIRTAPGVYRRVS